MLNNHEFKVGDAVTQHYADDRIATIKSRVLLPLMASSERDVKSDSLDEDFEQACAKYKELYGVEFCPGDDGDPTGKCWGPLYLIEDDGNTLPAYESELRLHARRGPTPREDIEKILDGHESDDGMLRGLNDAIAAVQHMQDRLHVLKASVEQGEVSLEAGDAALANIFMLIAQAEDEFDVSIDYALENS
jgi:hypothetical protein